MNVVLARLEDLGQFQPDARMRWHVSKRTSRRSRSRSGTAAPALAAPLIFCLCPSSPAFLETPERQAFKKRMMAFLSAALDETPGVQFLHYEQIDRLIRSTAGTIRKASGSAKFRTPSCISAPWERPWSGIRMRLFMPPFKVVALDCDNTLWSGICGEDGSEKASNSIRRAAHLQEFMVEQREAGMLLTMASKNNEQDVLDTFAAHPEMPLNLRHFIVLAVELGFEGGEPHVPCRGTRAWVSTASSSSTTTRRNAQKLLDRLPQVLTLALPDDIERTPEFLKHVWAFDHPVVTEEDRNRSVYYAQQQEFGAEVRRAASLEEFMASLDLRVSIQPIRKRNFRDVAN